MRFVDEVEVEISSGRGGRGASTFRREKYVPLGGPDGGDGGRGGHVIFRGDVGLGTLMDLRSRSFWKAGDGASGGKRRMTGAEGEDLVVRVPVGTIVTDATTGDVLFEILADGEERIAATGGAGGLGNVHFKTSTERAPRKATPGGAATTLRVRLELRLMADVGLLGYPNAGKSTLISAISAARPKVADYPFTTLTPHLGVVSMGTDGAFVVADIPGIIEGAAEGKGLGHQFLRHLQRTRMLVHLLSLADEEHGDVATRYATLREELGRYDPELLDRPEMVILTKADTVDEDAVEDARVALARVGARVEHVVSAVTGQGLPALVRHMWTALAELRGEPEA